MTKLTTTQLEEIRNRAEAATRGPWYVNCYGINDGKVSILEVTERGTVEAYDSNAVFIRESIQDIPALLAHIAELERINETFSKQLESVNKDRHLWRELRLESSGRLMEVVPRMTKYEEALQKIFEGEVDSLGDAFLIAKEALKDAES